MQAAPTVLSRCRPLPCRSRTPTRQRHRSPSRSRRGSGLVLTSHSRRARAADRRGGAERGLQGADQRPGRLARQSSDHPTRRATGRHTTRKTHRQARQAAEDGKSKRGILQFGYGPRFLRRLERNAPHEVDLEQSRPESLVAQFPGKPGKKAGDNPGRQGDRPDMPMTEHRCPRGRMRRGRREIARHDQPVRMDSRLG